MTPRIELAVTCSVAPLQIEGTVAGLQVYYRARHYRWRIELPDGTEASDEETWGSCSGPEEISLAYAMAKIFSVAAVRQAVADQEFEEYERMEEEARGVLAGGSGAVPGAGGFGRFLAAVFGLDHARLPAPAQSPRLPPRA